MQLKYRGISALRDRLRRLERQVEDPRDVMAAIGADLMERVKEGFENEHDPYGLPWKPLAPATLEHRRKRGVGAKILRDTGDMKESLNYRVAGRNAVAVGFSDKKAPWHQFGVTIERKTKTGVKKITIPARAMLPWRRGPGGVQLPPSWLHGIMTTLEDFLDV